LSACNTTAPTVANQKLRNLNETGIHIYFQEEVLALYAKEIAKLQRIITLAEKLIAESPSPKRGRPASHNGSGASKKRTNEKRVRRTGKALVKFRKMLKEKLKKGVSVAKLAHEQGISRTYIYQIK
jgi:hypothetical protein